MQTITVDINLQRGTCRIRQPLYLGSHVMLTFEPRGEEYSVVLTEPFADSPKAGIAVFAQSTPGIGLLSLNRKALHEAFVKADAMHPNMVVSAKMFIIDSTGQTVADGEVQIEYSPKSYIIDVTEYPTAKEVLAEAKSINSESQKVQTEIKESFAKFNATARRVNGGVELLIWDGKGEEPKPVFLADGKRGEYGFVKCDTDGKFYRLKCIDDTESGGKVLVLEQVAEEMDTIPESDIVRSINNISPDGNGNVHIPLDFLPLTGGSINGGISLNEGISFRCTNGHIISELTNGRLLFYGANNGVKGASLLLYGKDYQGGDAGAFLLRAADGEKLFSLIGKPDGTLTWDGKAIMLAGDCLPLTGGTLTGGLEFAQSAYIKRKDDTGFLNIAGGTEYEQGAVLILRGKDYADEPGWAMIRCVDGTNKTILVMKPDGTLTWGGKHVLRVVESWRSGSNWYRKYSDGWIEQGGVSALLMDDPDKLVTITFNTSFSSIPTLQTTFENTKGSRGAECLFSIGKLRDDSNATEQRSITKTGFYGIVDHYTGSGDDGGRLHWYACGY